MPYDVMSIGAFEVPETISDTGPILHLSEIGAYKHGMLKRAELNEAIEALFTSSTLHLGRAFRAYLRELLKELGT